MNEVMLRRFIKLLFRRFICVFWRLKFFLKIGTMFESVNHFNKNKYEQKNKKQNTNYERTRLSERRK